MMHGQKKSKLIIFQCGVLSHELYISVDL